jgi:hypothetical protein
MLKLKMRAPELMIGALMTVALIALGMLYEASRHTEISSRDQTQQTQAADQHTERSVGNGGESRRADNGDKKEGEFWSAKLTDWLLAVFTFFLVLFTYKLWQSTNNLWVETKRLAISQERDTQILQRAYLSVEGHGANPVSAVKTCIAEIGIRNVGNLPARDVKWFIDAGIDPSGSRAEFSIGTDFYGSNVIPPGTEMKRSHNFTVTKSELSQYQTKSLYVWGEIRYTDGFGNPRSTKFCHRYPGRTFTAGASGNNFFPASAMRYHRYGNDAD